MVLFYLLTLLLYLLFLRSFGFVLYLAFRIHSSKNRMKKIMTDDLCRSINLGKVHWLGQLLSKSLSAFLESLFHHNLFRVQYLHFLWLTISPFLEKLRFSTMNPHKDRVLRVWWLHGSLLSIWREKIQPLDNLWLQGNYTTWVF